MMETNPYCPECNGTGEKRIGGSFGGPETVYRCTCYKWPKTEAPKVIIERLWQTALKENPEDPLSNFVNMLIYCDWYDDKSALWCTEFRQFATDLIKEKR